MDIYFRRIGWNMKTSGHYTFCTIYGRVCHSFIKHGIQTIQYMINLIKSLFLKVSDKVFIIYPSTVLYNEHSVGRCFQNHIDCGINFTVIKLSFFGKLYELHVVLWRTELQGFFHGHTYQLYVPIFGGPIWHHNCCSGSVPSYIFKCLTCNVERGEM